jgi:PhnB protein
MPAADMFWGDRYGKVTDPFGHEWSFAHPLTGKGTKAA